MLLHLDLASKRKVLRMFSADEVVLCGNLGWLLPFLVGLWMLLGYYQLYGTLPHFGGP